jgi:LmbE family N-acetylglucosaminyl deacetylase
MPGILALLAHPDDEFFCAGLLASAVAQGVPVHLAYWTRGEGSGSPARRTVWRLVPRAWHYRVREARRAGRILGARSVTFLGAVDPLPRPEGPRAPLDDPARVRQKIAALLERHAPDLLVSHGSDGEYGHPAHRRLHEAARETAADRPLATFAAVCPDTPPVRFWNRSDPADFVFDSLPFLEKKLEILRAHPSQAGVLESIADPQAPTLRVLTEAGRFEGYRAWGEEPVRQDALRWLRRWTTEGAKPSGV